MLTVVWEATNWNKSGQDTCMKRCCYGDVVTTYGAQALSPFGSFKDRQCTPDSQWKGLLLTYCKCRSKVAWGMDLF